MSEILEGMKYLFKHGILHRDLKPANILNNRKNWKIADLGFAIYSDGEIKTKYNVGTPLYMPLESLVKNIYSPSTDIFSFGVIFYELLTGITPWECKNEKELIKKMNNLPYCLAERFKISSNNRALLEKLCSIDPS
jgi:serine/threonine protein kinase